MDTKNYITDFDVDEGRSGVLCSRQVKGHCKMSQASVGDFYELGLYGLDLPALIRNFVSTGCSS